MEETKQPRLEQLSVKVNSWTLDKWKELCKSGSFVLMSDNFDYVKTENNFQLKELSSLNNS